jgi:hypothetical protein
MVNFMCQSDWAKGCPGCVFQGVFPEKAVFFFFLSGGIGD